MRRDIGHSALLDKVYSLEKTQIVFVQRVNEKTDKAHVLLVEASKGGLQ